MNAASSDDGDMADGVMSSSVEAVTGGLSAYTSTGDCAIDWDCMSVGIPHNDLMIL